MAFLKGIHIADECLSKCIDEFERVRNPQKPPKKTMAEWEEFYAEKEKRVPHILERRRLALEREKYVASQLNPHGRAIGKLLSMDASYDTVAQTINECADFNITPTDIETWVKKRNIYVANLIASLIIMFVVSAVAGLVFVGLNCPDCALDIGGGLMVVIWACIWIWTAS